MNNVGREQVWWASCSSSTRPRSCTTHTVLHLGCGKVGHSPHLGHSESKLQPHLSNKQFLANYIHLLAGPAPPSNPQYLFRHALHLFQRLIHYCIAVKKFKSVVEKLQECGEGHECCRVHELFTKVLGFFYAMLTDCHLVFREALLLDRVGFNLNIKSICLCHLPF